MGRRRSTGSSSRSSISIRKIMTIRIMTAMITIMTSQAFVLPSPSSSSSLLPLLPSSRMPITAIRAHSLNTTTTTPSTTDDSSSSSSSSSSHHHATSSKGLRWLEKGKLQEAVEVVRVGCDGSISKVNTTIQDLLISTNIHVSL